jgi:hypothetical protein
MEEEKKVKAEMQAVLEAARQEAEAAAKAEAVGDS